MYRGWCKSLPRSWGAVVQWSQYLWLKLWDLSLELSKQWDLSLDPELERRDTHWQFKIKKKKLCVCIHVAQESGLNLYKAKQTVMTTLQKPVYITCVCVPIMLFGASWCSRALNLAGSLVRVIYHSTRPFPWGQKCCVWVCVLQEGGKIAKQIR